MASKSSPYIRQKNEKLQLEYDRIKALLPDFAIEYLDSKHSVTLSTKCAYAGDLLRFLSFYADSCEEGREVGTLTLGDISFEKTDGNPGCMMRRDVKTFFDAYVSYLQEYTGGNFTGNNRDSVERILVPVRGMYLYFSNEGLLTRNPMANFERYKEPERKAVMNLSRKDVRKLLNAVSQSEGINMSERELLFYEKTRTRDIAIIMLLLGTGIRVSECVGAEMKDLNLEENRLHVIRKGEHSDFVYFDSEVAEALSDYIVNDREAFAAKRKRTDEDPLFYSLRGNRISVDAVERLVGRYSAAAVPDKHVSPHGLRRTYGTNLYLATGDLGMVQDVLGHASPVTTKQFYVNAREENLKKAARINVYGQEDTDGS